MYLRTLLGAIMAVQSIVLSSCDSNVTTQNKSKRGIYDLGDGTGYNVLPAQHIGTYTQVRALSQGETPFVDLTYKPAENAAQAENVFTDTHGGATNDNVYNGQTFYPQQQLLHAYNPNTRIPQHLNFQNNGIKEQQVNSAHHHIAQHHPVTFYPKLSSPLTVYGADKQFINPAGNIKTSQEIKLPQYSTIPGLYGQGNLSPLKFVQPATVPQFNHGLTLPTIHQPLQQYINPQHHKLPAKITYAHTLNQQRPSQNQQSHNSPSPMSQITQNFKSIQPNFFQPQIFENPVVPQLQHYIPQVQNPFDAFTRPIKPSLPIQEKPREAELQKPKEKEADPEDGKVQHKIKEEIQGEVIHEEIDDEDEFEKGYDDSARGFPAYENKDDDDDYRRGRYQKHNDDDSHGRYENHQSSRYTSHDDHDDDDHDHEDYHRDHDYQRPYDYDDERRGRYYSDHDHEGSQHHHKKHEPRETERDSRPRPSKSHKTSHKYYKKGETDHLSSKRPIQSGKYYKSTSSSLRKPTSDARHASSAPKTQVKASSHTKTPVKSEGELSPPKYQYGFEPIRSPYSQGNKGVIEDTEARHSSPVSKKKIYKENWYLAKSSES